METETFTIETGSRQTTDLTSRVAHFVADKGSGLVNVFLPHATAGIAVIETGAGSDDDLETTLDRLLPRDDRYRHRHGAKGHGADHVLPALVSPSLTVPVVDGQMLLGVWQSIVLVDTNTDNPRRTVHLSMLTD